jgi:hypothetical protein
VPDADDTVAVNVSVSPVCTGLGDAVIDVVVAIFEDVIVKDSDPVLWA